VSRWTRIRAWLKGVLITNLPKQGLRVVDTHPVSNQDGDWSEAGRYFPLHQKQLDVLAQLMRHTATPAVVCGDFNIDRDSLLFSRFLAETRLTDVFGGKCPATFHAEFLGPADPPHCIDFILPSSQVKTEATQLLFTGKEVVHGQAAYLSDHIGLSKSGMGAKLELICGQLIFRNNRSARPFSALG
jgi:endonuclease/exonuclease/phosphatase family metal-dependent hydrolase